MSAASKIDLENFSKVTEGSANILFPKSAANVNDVFYNKVQEFNRDITIAAITQFTKDDLLKKEILVHETKEEDKNVINISETSDDVKMNKHAYPGEHCQEGIKILEALSATGLRSVRMANEIPGVKKIIANDLSKKAVEAINRNILFNNVQEFVEANEEDACVLMLQHKPGRNEPFDVVDIDPYGTASPFLDSAVQAVRSQGLLCVTCTDMAVLAGNTPEKCWSNYRCMPQKIKACHEQALRILLSKIEQHANTYSRYIEPLLSVSVDFYIRIFVKVHYGAGKVKESAAKNSYTVKCAGCGSFTLHPVCEKIDTKKSFKYVPGSAPRTPEKCEFCGHKKHTIGGPIWNGPLHNIDFVETLLSSVKAFPHRFKTAERIKGFLTMILEELHDVPLHYVISELSKVMKIDSPPENEIRSAICNAGYRVSSFHGSINSLKTDAPNSLIWDTMKAWAIKSGKNLEGKNKNDSSKQLLEREMLHEIDFTHSKGAIAKSKQTGITRFPDLPANWGPKARAKMGEDGSVTVSETLEEKRKRLQGKRKNGVGDENDENSKAIKTDSD